MEKFPDPLSRWVYCSEVGITATPKRVGGRQASNGNATTNATLRSGWGRIRPSFCQRGQRNRARTNDRTRLAMASAGARPGAKLGTMMTMWTVPFSFLFLCG